MSDFVSIADFLQVLGRSTLLDVRAPVEFWEGQMPDSVNLPILANDERHLVGLRYKQAGQDAAVSLGHLLVTPLKAARVEAWKRVIHPDTIITCWRGGLRSATAQSWLRETGVDCRRLQGGYKALRNRLVEEFSIPRRGFLVAGFTGSGKTEFMATFTNTIDLENLARHRGSSFGGWLERPQPSQATFENALAYRLLAARGPILLESESRLVGRLVIPEPLFAQMKSMPKVVLQLERGERARRLTKEYVLEPLRDFPPWQVEAWLVESLRKIHDRLGGAAHDKILARMKTAFLRSEPNPEEHAGWVEDLLELYYDPLYQHSMTRDHAPVVFEGSPTEVRQWLKSAL